MTSFIFSSARFFLLIGSMMFCTGRLLAAEESKEADTKESQENKGTKEGNKELLDFSSIKDIIKKDGLEGELKKKQEEKRKYLDAKKLTEMKRYNVPTQDVFWSFFSELWLVKNATMLKWDIHKPDFELEKSFIQFLESQGHYEKKIKILLVDTAEIAHAALPTNNDEYIFIISLPFIRTLDLSKVEISLILFEDFVRVRKGYFKNYVQTKELEEYLGTNFSGKPFNKKLIDESLKKYNQVLFEKGFSFQEQFETTKEIDVLLKNDLKMWNTYLTLLEKIDNLTKTNTLYKKYSQIYPSPELQLNWLKPKSTVL
jgi:hypothetical protein